MPKVVASFTALGGASRAAGPVIDRDSVRGDMLATAVFGSLSTSETRPFSSGRNGGRHFGSDSSKGETEPAEVDFAVKAEKAKYGAPDENSGNTPYCLCGGQRAVAGGGSVFVFALSTIQLTACWISGSGKRKRSIPRRHSSMRNSKQI